MKTDKCKFFYHGYCLHDDAPKSDISCIGIIDERGAAGGGCGAWQDGSMKLNVGNLEIAFDLLCSKEK